MRFLLCCVLLAQVVAPPVPPRCLVRLPIFQGEERTECDDGDLKKLSELTNTQDLDLAEVELFETANLADLIAIRGLAIFDSQSHNLENLHICPKHLNELGKEWRRRDNQKHHAKCRVPPLEGFQGEHGRNVDSARRMHKNDCGWKR